MDSFLNFPPLDQHYVCSIRFGKNDLRSQAGRIDERNAEKLLRGTGAVTFGLKVHCVTEIAGIDVGIAKEDIRSGTAGARVEVNVLPEEFATRYCLPGVESRAVPVPAIIT